MKSEQMPTGEWWKFDRYEIKGGYIRPAPGAKLQRYDPWEAYSESWHHTRREPPYQSLLKLLFALGSEDSKGDPTFAHGVGDATSEYERAEAEARSWETFDDHWFADVLEAEMTVDYWRHAYFGGLIEYDEALRGVQRVIPRAGIGLIPLKVCGVLFNPTPAHLARLRRLSPLPPHAKERIASWCSEYGLLGVLPHAAESVTLSAKWTLGEGWNPELRCMAEAEEHYRAHGQWLTRTLNCAFDRGADLDAILGPNPVAGTFLPPSEGYSPRCPGVRMRHADNVEGEMAGLSEETLFETWCSFFPTIRSAERLTYRYPRPLTEEFWEVYEEPLEIFLQYALIFQHAVVSDVRRLGSLLEPIGIALQLDDEGGVKERWNCPSLVSAFAKMAAQDAAWGCRVLRCPACGSPFPSSAYQAVYCSQVCGWRDRKRRARRARNDGGQRGQEQEKDPRSQPTL